MLKPVKFQARKTLLTGLNIPFNKWKVLSGIGLIPFAGYGIWGTSAQSLNASENANSPYEQNFVSTTIESETPKDIDSPKSEDVLDNSKNPKVTNVSEASDTTPKPSVDTNDASEILQVPQQPAPLVSQNQNIVSKPTVTEEPRSFTTGDGLSQEESLDKYDSKYLEGVSSFSIAWRRKDKFLVVPKNHSIWKKKLEKIIKKAEESKDKKLFTYWKDKTITATQLQNDPEWAYNWCKHSLSYTEFGTWAELNKTKGYWSFLWEVCGREDRSKPSSYWLP